MIYVNQLNSFDENIQFTFEIEEENNLAFLDLMVTGNKGEAKKALLTVFPLYLLQT